MMWWILAVVGCGEADQEATADTSVEAPPLVEYQCGETAPAYDGYPLVMLSGKHGDGTPYRAPVNVWEVQDGALVVGCDQGTAFTVRWLE